MAAGIFPADRLSQVAPFTCPPATQKRAVLGQTCGSPLMAVPLRPSNLEARLSAAPALRLAVSAGGGASTVLTRKLHSP